jgi:hypothetical protein
MRTPLFLPLALVAWAGCTGNLDGPTGPGRGSAGQLEPGAASGQVDEHGNPVPDSDGRPIGQSGLALRCDPAAPIDPGPSPLRLLSREQYFNTLRDLFGAAGDVRSLLTGVEEPSEFGLLQADVSLVELEDFQKAADAVAAKVVADKTMLAALAPCTAADKRACARSFVEKSAARAYRAPLTDAADIERHLKLYDLGAKTSHEHGIELVLRGVLQSPRFLYRVELGSSEKVADNAVRLSDYELAARLSYVFWKTLPDTTLTQAAAAGKLHTPDELEAQLERMLADPKGKLALRQFLENLMHLGQLPNLVKDKTLYPEWQNQALRTAMAEQARAFFEHVLDKQSGSLEALLTSTTLQVNKDVASFYGLSGGTSFAPVEHADGFTAGLLSLPALLAIQAKPNESSPIYRGKFVREALLCEQMPTPPANIPKPPEVQAGVSTRERLRQHEVDPSCSGCHNMLDPVGFGFEHFDALGRFRSKDGGRDVDALGELIGSRDADGKFEGVVELAARLAGSAQVEECMTRQWFRFALGRFEQKQLDDCTLSDSYAAFKQESNSLHALPRAIVRSAAFLHRRPIVKETP